MFSCCIYFVSINMLNRPMEVLLSVQLRRLIGDRHCEEADEDGDLAGLDVSISPGKCMTSDLY